MHKLLCIEWEIIEQFKKTIESKLFLEHKIFIVIFDKIKNVS